jgi:hypothetical protein
MGIMSKQQYLNLKSCVVRKSYTVHHKYARPSRIYFKTRIEAKKYCIQHKLDHTSSWVLTTINHCA